MYISLSEKCPNTEFFLIRIVSIRIEYGDLPLNWLPVESGKIWILSNFSVKKDFVTLFVKFFGKVLFCGHVQLSQVLPRSKMDIPDL